MVETLAYLNGLSVRRPTNELAAVGLQMLELETLAPVFYRIDVTPLCESTASRELGGRGRPAGANQKYAALFFPYPKWSLLRRVRIRDRMRRPQCCLEGVDQHLCRHGGRHFPQAQA